MEWMSKISQGLQGVTCSSQQEQPLPCQSGGAGSVLSRAAKSSVITALGHNGHLGKSRSAGQKGPAPSNQSPARGQSRKCGDGTRGGTRGDGPSPPGTRQPGQRSVRPLRDSSGPVPLASSRQASERINRGAGAVRPHRPRPPRTNPHYTRVPGGVDPDEPRGGAQHHYQGGHDPRARVHAATYIGDKTGSRHAGPGKSPHPESRTPSSEGPRSPLGESSEASSLLGRAGRAAESPTRGDPDPASRVGPRRAPSAARGDQPRCGGPGRSQRPGPCSPLRGRRGEPGSSRDRPQPQGDRDSPAGPRGTAAGAKPPVPPKAETKPWRKDPGSRPRTLRSPARSRHARGRDPRPVRRPRRPSCRLTSGCRLAALAPRRGAWAD
ncbi:uncharacterized protein LOC100430375 [Macaca mulatta]